MELVYITIAVVLVAAVAAAAGLFDRKPRSGRRRTRVVERVVERPVVERPVVEREVRREEY